MRETFGRTMSAQQISNDPAKPSMKWLFIFADGTRSCFSTRDKKMKWRNPQEKSAAHGPANHARRDSDDLRSECRFLKDLNSRCRRSQNNHLFKLPTQFAR
jgi:hypothetical protein